MNSKYCSITDKSSISTRKFDVLFDYKSSIADWKTSSERNKMLFGQTWQLAACEWTTSKLSYNVSLKIRAGFGFGSSKNGGGIFCPRNKYTCYNSATFASTYSRRI